MAKKQILIEQFKWAGKWGPFKVKVRCGECDLTTSIIKSLMQKEFKGKQVKFVIKPWLDNWISCAFRGGFRAPLVFVDRKLFTAHDVPDRNKLKEAVLEALKL